MLAGRRALKGASAPQPIAERGRPVRTRGREFVVEERRKLLVEIDLAVGGYRPMLVVGLEARRGTPRAHHYVL